MSSAKKGILALVIALPIFVQTANAGQYEDGFSAFQRGDYATAIRLMRPLAEQGNADAQFNLGVSYFNGKGLPQDYTEASRWYRKAAEQGSSEAQLSLGLLYALGKGVDQDYSEAGSWYRKSAEQGYAQAQYSHGWFYVSGKGAPQDYVQAHMWTNLAAAAGIDGAIKNRDVIEKLMTPDQIAQAQRMAREWADAH